MLVQLATILIAFLRNTIACPSGLNTGAQAQGKYFGTATSQAGLLNEAYVHILDDTADFGQITPENGMKWADVQPQQNSFTFTQADAIVSSAKANHQILRCHALVWYQDLPTWVTDSQWTNATLIDVLQTHIKTIVDRYRGSCYAWDVVNEALNDDGSLRDSIFLKVIGPAYIPLAFAAAAHADSHAKLYYNDYNIDNDFSQPFLAPSNPGRRADRSKLRVRQSGSGSGGTPSAASGSKVVGAKGLVDMIRAYGARIDGMGLQGHYVYNSTPTSTTLASVMSDFAAMDLDVAITELDIRMDLSNINPSTTELQSQGYANVVTACKNTPRCVGITLWNFSDAYSWVNTVYVRFGSSLPWDSNLELKTEIYDAMMQSWCDGT